MHVTTHAGAAKLLAGLVSEPANRRETPKQAAGYQLPRDVVRGVKQVQLLAEEATDARVTYNGVVAYAIRSTYASLVPSLATDAMDRMTGPPLLARVASESANRREVAKQPAGYQLPREVVLGVKQVQLLAEEASDGRERVTYNGVVAYAIRSTYASLVPTLTPADSTLQ